MNFKMTDITSFVAETGHLQITFVLQVLAGRGF